MELKKENFHKDHRKRLKTKVKNFGLECLADHEVLELLLTYTIPRKDTNPTAHNLIEHFGSFSKVFDASYDDLVKVDGVGPESALFLNMIGPLLERYSVGKKKVKAEFLTNTGKCVDFFRNNFAIKVNEFMVMACLSKSKRVVKTFMYKGHDETEITFDIRNLAKKINDDDVFSVVLFHTHPNGSVEPSLSDIKTTQKVINVCMFQGIDFDDHIILNESEHFSFSRKGLIGSMKGKYVHGFELMSDYLEVADGDKILIDDEEKPTK